MSILSWGKPTLEVGEYAETPTYAAFTGTIVENTAQLVTNKGTAKEAKESGGGIVDKRYDKSSYSFSMEIYVKKGDTRPMEDDDGVVAGHKSLRLTPEDPTNEGFEMKKCIVTVEETFSDEIGKKLKYTFDGIRPATGKTVVPYTKPA